MKKRVMTYAMLVLGIALVAVGIVQGQQQAVLAKAIKICLECVGIG